MASKQIPNRLKGVSNAKRLRMIQIVEACRKVYEKSLDFLENHPNDVDEELLEELSYELLSWYKKGELPPYLLFTTARYVLTKIRKDYDMYWHGRGEHPVEKFKRGYDKNWKLFKVPISNVIIDPYRRTMMVMGIGYFEYTRSLPDLETISILTFKVERDFETVSALTQPQRKR